MQQILNFIQKNSHKMLFLLLLSFSISLIIRSHAYHRSEYINTANNVSGFIYKKTNTINEYLNLIEKNAQLAEENTILKEILFNKKDTVLTTKKIKSKHISNYKVRTSKVLKNVFNTRENYLTILYGSKVGLKTDMGVVNEKGVIGIIEKTSANYATVLSILNSKIKINAKIKKSNHFGSITWDGEDIKYVQLIDVPRLASLKKGDSIVTGADSDIFPENIPIGKIDKIYTNPKTNYYTISVRLFNDMTSLGYVYVIENKTKIEKETLEAATLVE